MGTPAYLAFYIVSRLFFFLWGSVKYKQMSDARSDDAPWIVILTVMAAFPACGEVMFGFWLLAMFFLEWLPSFMKKIGEITDKTMKEFLKKG